MDLSQFIHVAAFPQDHPQGLHPALLNVIYLAACSLSGQGSFISSFEGVFLARARQELESSLAYADRLVHFIWANIILGVYFARAGRLVEAYNTVSATVRFAVGCGLHRAKEHGPLNEAAAADGPILPIADVNESQERHVLWCCVYILDRYFSLAAQFPGSVPKEVSDLI